MPSLPVVSQESLASQVDDELIEKHRVEIEGLIEIPPPRKWDDLHGQDKAKKDGQVKLRAIKDAYEHQGPNGMLLTGPPGVGKTTFAEIFASELGGTLFIVDKGFAKGRPELWQVLFVIAEEKAPSIILIDEVDGVMSAQHKGNLPAIKKAFQSNSKPVIVMGATNHPERLDSAIQSRFGPSIDFQPIDASAIRPIIASNMKFELDLTDDDCDELLKRTCGDGRVLAGIAKEVAMIVEDQIKTRGRTKLTVTFDDFEARLPDNESSSMSPETISAIVDWCKKTFYQDPAPKAGSDEKVVSLRYMLELLNDLQLKALGFSNIRGLRQNPKYPIKGKEAQFIDNLMLCFNRAGLNTELKPTGKNGVGRIFLSLINGAESEMFDTKSRDVFTNLRFR